MTQVWVGQRDGDNDQVNSIVLLSPTKPVLEANTLPTSPWIARGDTLLRDTKSLHSLQAYQQPLQQMVQI